MTASLLYKATCFLGEGPVWHSQRKSFFWVDIEGKCIYEYHWKKRQVSRWQLERRVSLIVEEESDKLVLALQNGLARFDLNTGVMQWLLDIEKEIPANRTNDGACDSNGRLWIGTMDIDCKENAGALYCIDHDAVPAKKISNLTISNGLVWSPDDKNLYHIDSPAYTVASYFFDPRTGSVIADRTVIHIPHELGMPDGMTIDTEGMLWIAHWGGFGISRWDPLTGNLLERISVPVPNVTSCAFGGEQFDQLFITTARQHLNEKELNEYPDSGSIFIIRPGIKGIPANKYGQKNTRLPG